MTCQFAQLLLLFNINSTFETTRYKGEINAKATCKVAEGTFKTFLNMIFLLLRNSFFFSRRSATIVIKVRTYKVLCPYKASNKPCLIFRSLLT